MSELIATGQGRTFRLGLLTQVSMLALIGAVGTQTSSNASEESRPTVWIELGGQLERLNTEQTIFEPAFFDAAVPNVVAAMTDSQRPSRYDSGLEGKIRFAPKGINWIFSAGVRYGQVANERHLHYETRGLPSFEILKNGQPNPANGLPRQIIVPQIHALGDGQTHSTESHLIVDFQAGKDVGIGLFQNTMTSVLEVGVRFAQFTSRADVNLHGRPVNYYGPAVRFKRLNKYYTRPFPVRQTNYAEFHSTRSTHAIGPSVSLEGSLPIAGQQEAMTVDLDWGVNAAALFGRQRTVEEHQTNGKKVHYNINVGVASSYSSMTAHSRSRFGVIPNVGGFLGLSLKFPNAKVSLGYRGDFFFNATDSGIDLRDAADQNFYGPFATISFGLGG